MGDLSALDVISYALLFAGAFFFVAGTVGLLRFPDVYVRLHALTKVNHMMHAKVMVVEGRWVLLGSTNIDHSG